MKQMLLPVLLVLVALAALPTEVRADPPVRVPRVEGLALDPALRRLEQAGLVAEITWSADLPARQVGSQSPAAGDFVEAGSVVDLLVGVLLPVDTIVPNVVGLDEESAVLALDALYGLDIEDVDAPPGQDGLVLAQDPRPGTRLAFRATLRLQVGRAGLAFEGVLVPPVVGLDLLDAETALLDQGLVTQAVLVRTQRDAPWIVMRQEPAAGSIVAPGTPVVLQVAYPQGPSGVVRLPSLIGQDPRQASQLLLNLGLRPELVRVPSVLPTETIIRQEPSAGSNVVPGTSVRLTIAFPAGRTHVPARVVVPDLQGRSMAEVWLLARRAGVQVEIRRRLAPNEPVDRVLAQRPTPGVRVPLGTSVDVYLPLTATVPPLVGLEVDAAQQAVAAAGLAIALEGGGGRPRGYVVTAQDPGPGSTVAQGSVVQVRIDRRPGVVGTRVPELRGRSVEEAKDLLQAAGLRGRFHGPSILLSPLTEVTTQDPVPGALVRPGTVVDVTYRLRPPPQAAVVRVPDLRGRSLQEADALLRQRGLVPNVSVVRGGGPPGVTGQSPAAGSLVQRGTEVRFTLRR